MSEILKCMIDKMVNDHCLLKIRLRGQQLLNNFRPILYKYFSKNIASEFTL